MAGAATSTAFFLKASSTTLNLNVLILLLLLIVNGLLFKKLSCDGCRAVAFRTTGL
jgi:hypothetical protein